MFSVHRNGDHQREVKKESSQRGRGGDDHACSVAYRNKTCEEVIQFLTRKEDKAELKEETEDRKRHEAEGGQMLLHRLKDTKGERTLFYTCEQAEGEEEERIKYKRCQELNCSRQCISWT